MDFYRVKYGCSTPLFKECNKIINQKKIQFS